MSDFSKLTASLLDEFGSSRVQPGIYRLGPLNWAIHLSQPKADKSGSAYVSGDIRLTDPVTGEDMGTLRNMVGSVADKSKKRVMMAPSRDGLPGSVAGPPDVNPQMLIKLAKGDEEFADEDEEAQFTGPFLLTAPGVKKMKGQLTQFFEEFKKLTGVDVLNGQRDGRVLDGYVVELDSRPNAFPSKRKKKEGEEEYDDDVLVPVRLVARPGEALPAAMAHGMAQAAPQTGPQATVAALTQAPLPTPQPVSVAALATPAQAAPVQAPAPTPAPTTGAPTAQQIEGAIYQLLGGDWQAQRDFIVPLMQQFPSEMPTVLSFVQNPQWLYSPERALWESNPTQQLIKKRG